VVRVGSKMEVFFVIRYRHPERGAYTLFRALS